MNCFLHPRNAPFLNKQIQNKAISKHHLLTFVNAMYRLYIYLYISYKPPVHIYIYINGYVALSPSSPQPEPEQIQIQPETPQLLTTVTTVCCSHPVYSSNFLLISFSNMPNARFKLFLFLWRISLLYLTLLTHLRYVVLFFVSVSVSGCVDVCVCVCVRVSFCSFPLSLV